MQLAQRDALYGGDCGTEAKQRESVPDVALMALPPALPASAELVEACDEDGTAWLH